MKKYLSLFLVFTVVLGALACPCVAVASDNVEHVLSMVKERIPDTSAYSEFDSSVNVRGGFSQYHFNWNSNDGGNYISLSVSATDDGIITSYSEYKSKANYSDKLSINKLSSDDAMQKAVVLAEKLNPKLAGCLQLTKSNLYESLTNDGYTFMIQRLENGIPVYGDTGSITINSACDSIDNYYINYTQGLTFEPSDNVISRDTAIGKYREKIGMELYYASDYSTDEHKSAYLSYRPAATDEYIDALSGETVKPQASYGFRGGYESSKNELADSVMAAGAFTEAEISNLAEIESLISVEEAIKIANENKYIRTASVDLLKSRYTYKNSDGQYMYSLQFGTDTEYNDYSDVTINAQNGEITNVYQYFDKITDKDAKEIPTEKFKEVVSYFVPQKYEATDNGEYRLYEKNGNSCEFVRYINDIPYYVNTIRVTLNPNDASLVSYSINHSEKTEFMSPDGIISEYDATESLFDKQDYELCYYPCVASENDEFNTVTKLIYKLEDGTNEIYADSGRLVRYDDEVRIGDYADISGHYAEEIISTLARFGIGFEGNEFCPDDIITQKDFVALVTSVVSNQNPIVVYRNTDYENYYRRAHSKNIIKDSEKSPDSLVTRETACVYFIRAIGLESAAELDGIYLTKFSDVKDNIGYISILAAMGVVSGFGGMFNPEKPLTRADAMIMIYNYLK